MLKNKIKAFTIHLIISIVVTSIIAGVMIYFWYPLDYLDITSFKDIATLIIFIDLVIGPILTFVVFNPNKKSLKFDLSIIAMIQVSALAYGTFILYQGHPVYLTYAKGSFTLINAQLARPQDAKYEEYRVSKLSSSNLAYAELPNDATQRNELLNISFKGGADLEERVDLYKPYHEHIDEIISNTLDTTKLFSDKKSKSETELFIKKYGEKVNDFVFIPLEGSTGSSIVVLDKRSASFVTTINVDPWEYAKNE